LPKWIAYAGVDGISKWIEASKRKEYYQTYDETKIIENQARHIASRVLPNAVMVDFGAGYEELYLQPLAQLI
jgi:uncharacterized SAM-dependent methyltransferase